MRSFWKRFTTAGIALAFVSNSLEAQSVGSGVCLEPDGMPVLSADPTTTVTTHFSAEALRKWRERQMLERAGRLAREAKLRETNPTPPAYPVGIVDSLSGGQPAPVPTSGPAPVGSESARRPMTAPSATATLPRPANANTLSIPTANVPLPATPVRAAASAIPSVAPSSSGIVRTGGLESPVGGVVAAGLQSTTTEAAPPVPPTTPTVTTSTSNPATTSIHPPAPVPPSSAAPATRPVEQFTRVLPSAAPLANTSPAAPAPIAPAPTPARPVASVAPVAPVAPAPAMIPSTANAMRPAITPTPVAPATTPSALSAAAGPSSAPTSSAPTSPAAAATAASLAPARPATPSPNGITAVPRAVPVTGNAPLVTNANSSAPNRPSVPMHAPPYTARKLPGPPGSSSLATIDHTRPWTGERLPPTSKPAPATGPRKWLSMARFGHQAPIKEPPHAPVTAAAALRRSEKPAANSSASMAPRGMQPVASRPNHGPMSIPHATPARPAAAHATVASAATIPAAAASASATRPPAETAAPGTRPSLPVANASQPVQGAMPVATSAPRTLPQRYSAPPAARMTLANAPSNQATRTPMVAQPIETRTTVQSPTVPRNADLVPATGVIPVGQPPAAAAAQSTRLSRINEESRLRQIPAASPRADQPGPGWTSNRRWETTSASSTSSMPKKDGGPATQATTGATSQGTKTTNSSTSTGSGRALRAINDKYNVGGNWQPARKPAADASTSSAETSGPNLK